MSQVLDVTNSLHLALTTSVEPRIDNIFKTEQEQRSH